MFTFIPHLWRYTNIRRVSSPGTSIGTAAICAKWIRHPAVRTVEYASVRGKFTHMATFNFSCTYEHGPYSVSTTCDDTLSSYWAAFPWSRTYIQVTLGTNTACSNTELLALHASTRAPRHFLARQQELHFSTNHHNPRIRPRDIVKPIRNEI
jgi:hypothetical protein